MRPLTQCRCGFCDGTPLYLCSGIDGEGKRYTNEPACGQAADYLGSAAAELDLAFERQPYVEPALRKKNAPTRANHR